MGEGLLPYQRFPCPSHIWIEAVLGSGIYGCVKCGAWQETENIERPPPPFLPTGEGVSDEESLDD